MKKIIFSISSFIFATGAYSQTDSSRIKTPPDEINNMDDKMNQYKSDDLQRNPDSKLNQNQIDNHPDGYMMHNGKMTMVKNGKMAVMENDITLSNGTMIMSNGNYIIKGEKKMMIKKSEHFDMNGKLISRK